MTTTERPDIYEGMCKAIDEVWGGRKGYDSAEFQPGSTWAGHDGRIVLDVAPESEKVVACIWVFYNKPNQRHDENVVLMKEERKRTGDEHLCPRFLSLKGGAVTPEGRACTVWPDGNHWEAIDNETRWNASAATKDDVLAKLDVNVVEFERLNLGKQGA